MFRFNAFGQRVYCHPRIVFIDPADGAGGSGSGSSTDEGKGGDEHGDSDKGFPANTPWREMTHEQQAAYWRDKSQKHERTANARKDYDTIAQELADLKNANQSDAEKELEDAREEARRQGENIGAQRYLKDAVKGRFQGLTRKTDDEVETIFAHVDPATFTDDKGEIDLEQLRAYAATFDTKNTDDDSGRDPVAAALGRQRRAGGGAGVSIAEKRKQVRESMTKKPA
jgi:hypothetical protein